MTLFVLLTVKCFGHEVGFILHQFNPKKLQFIKFLLSPQKRPKKVHKVNELLPAFSEELYANMKPLYDLFHESLKFRWEKN